MPSHQAVPVDYGDGYECRVCGAATDGAHPRHLADAPARPAPAAPRPAGLPPLAAPIQAGTTTVNGTAAALAAVPGTGTLRRQIVEAVRLAPATDDELETRLGRTHQSVSAARNRLVEDGWLEPMAVLGEIQTRPTRSGNDATVWALSPEGRAALHRGAAA